MKQTIIESLSPLAQASRSKGAKAVISGSSDMYGACSIEHFSSASSLSLTHDDAQGWLDYVTQFVPGNFWYRDAGVQVWKYEETYDNWQDTYGADAVVAFYHSGHGAMDGNGVFQAPLGSKWDNRDWAFSNRMTLGNETVRYLFWSTCFSLRISAPHNPIRTWHPVNRGFRMVFGFETVSVDNANYGRNFWNNYRQTSAGRPFSGCWLDASWQISHNQAPVVMATGTSAADAQNRLFNENKFWGGAGSSNYYWWRWYNAASSANLSRAALGTIPKKPRIAILSGEKDAAAEAKKIAKALGINQKNAGNLMFNRDGSTVLRDNKRQVTLDKWGQITGDTGVHNYKNTDLIDEREAIGIAEGVLADTGLDKKVTLELEKVIHGSSCGGTSKGSGTIGEEQVTETIVQYRQMIDGLPAVNSGNGLVRISIDNDGKVVNLINSTKKVDELSSKAKGSLAPKPRSKSATNTFGATSEAEVEKQFQVELARITGHGANGNGNGSAKAAKSTKAKIIEDKIGYNLNGGIGSVVAHREYEVEMGKGLRKRYKLRVPIVV